MGHQETYKHNEAYAEFLSTWEEGFYKKYADALSADLNCSGNPKILDVGCGVGQVVKILSKKGFDACGVDVSEANIARAKSENLNCNYYDGHHLPFDSESLNAAGSFNVLEHVEEPEAFLKELVRVVKPGGRIVVSSPNFLRVLGFHDYHPRMRGIFQKYRNLKQILAIRKSIKYTPDSVTFERMQPIFKEPFTADDDAIVATNPLQISFFLRRFGCRIERVCCTDRYVNKLAEFVLNCSPLRYVIFNGFVIATKGNI